MPDLAFDAIGTRWTITTREPIDEGLRAEVAAVIERYDRTWSRFRADSAVLELAATLGPVDLGPEAADLLPLLLDLSARTDGALNPLVGGSLEHLGYDRATSLDDRPGFAPAPSADVLELDGTVARLRAPAVLDVGAAGKGQLVDLVLDVLERAGAVPAVVDAGGDLRAAGGPVRVGLEHPFDPSAAIGVVTVDEGAIAGSGVNRRAWPGQDGRRLHHVLDARTGRPVETLAATWALAPTALLADALATALFLVEPAALDGYAFDYVRMRTDGVADFSPDLPGELFG
ncbi:FAD:protein FMN transferase [Amnibacterium sp. CER49]|uniref:FAD:protein FMN transferase n=1 Tax=Amnibacterium sp. CER49 TaxID=3039161 RepID=UPI002449DF54|nr:FAD:protein FMN transferase [Amnibacterium sp. CER49]MDH2445251.1 FAD:protein FMN transferase [Amnibacterium sp. CER49]